MKKSEFIVFLFISITLNLSAQKTDVLKVKKQQSDFLFFQADKKCDTIYAEKNNTFVLALPDSIVFDVEIKVNNGRLMYNRRSNSFNLQFLPTLNYRHFLTDSLHLLNVYTPEAQEYKKSPRVFGNKFYVTQINGSNNNTTRQIQVEIYQTKTGQLLLKNTFLYFNKP